MPKNQSTAAARARAAARQGAKYTDALASLRSEALAARPAPAEAPPLSGEKPWSSYWDGNPFHDVNHACGHHLRALCGGCGVCTTCDGCYCGEDDGWSGDDQRRHDDHYGEHDDHVRGCAWCEDEHKQSAGYTCCATCELAFPDGRIDYIRHGLYCSPLYPQPSTTDWTHILDQDVELVGRTYTITGHVLPWAEQQRVAVVDGRFTVTEQPRRTPTATLDRLRPALFMRRTDEDNEGDLAPFNPREWLEVRVTTG